MQNKFKYLIFFILAALAGLYFYNKYRVAPGVDFNKLSLYNLEGKPVSFAQFQEKKLIVSFGASWCGNCITELKTLNNIKDTQLSDVEIVVISDEPLETVQRFREKRGPAFTFLKMEQPFSSIGINAIPTTYILNTKLQTMEETVGYIDWEDPATVDRLKKLME